MWVEQCVCGLKHDFSGLLSLKDSCRRADTKYMETMSQTEMQNRVNEARRLVRLSLELRAQGESKLADDAAFEALHTLNGIAND